MSQKMVYLKQIMLTLGIAALVVLGYVVGVDEANRQKLFDYYYELSENISQKKISIGQQGSKAKVLVS